MSDPRDIPKPLDQTLAFQDQQAAAVATAPRVSLGNIEDEIVQENYLNVGKAIAQLQQPDHAAHHLITLCVLVLRNGYTVIGEGACASPENYNAELGHTIARRHAIEKVWPLLAFRLRDRLSEQALVREVDEALK